MNQVSISTYHEYILEGIASLRQGLSISKASFETSDLLEMQDGVLGEMYCRYSFLMLANSLEAAANALLFSAYNTEKEFYEEVEKLNTLLKFQLFCRSFGAVLTRGDNRYSRVKELISCRNEFVHPKPRRVYFAFDPENSSVNYKIKRSPERQYPHYFADLKPYHVLYALEDTLAFISWVCFDTCKLGISEGTLKLGLNSYGATSDIDIIEAEYSKKFDKRSFGKG